MSKHGESGEEKLPINRRGNLGTDPRLKVGSAQVERKEKKREKDGEMAYVHTYVSLLCLSEIHLRTVHRFSVFSGSSSVILTGEILTCWHERPDGHGPEFASLWLSGSKQSKEPQTEASASEHVKLGWCSTLLHHHPQPGQPAVSDCLMNQSEEDSHSWLFIILGVHVFQSYSGRAPDGHPLFFHLRDPSFPSQHKTHPDLSDITTRPRCLLQSHTQEVHGPKYITAVRLQQTVSVPNVLRHNSYRFPVEFLTSGTVEQFSKIYIAHTCTW